MRRPVIGAPGYDDPLSGATGTVTIAQGSNRGISAIGAIRLQGKGARERFGASVVADGDDVWVGAPDRKVDGQAAAGAVDHYRIANGAASLVQTLTEDTPGIHGGAETNDHFGAHLSVSTYGPLVIGEPDEDVGAHAVNAGTVTVVFTDRSTGLVITSGTYSQDSPGIPGSAEAGDHFGASVSSVLGSAGGTGGPDTWTTFSRGGSSSGDLGGAPQSGAAVGTQLSRLAYNGEGDSFLGGENVVITLPGANFTVAASGEVILPGALTATDSSGPVTGERYGVAATAVSNGADYRT